MSAFCVFLAQKAQKAQTTQWIFLERIAHPPAKPVMNDDEFHQLPYQSKSYLHHDALNY